MHGGHRAPAAPNARILLPGVLAVVLAFGFAPARGAHAQPIPARVLGALDPRGAQPVRWPRAPLLLSVRDAVGAAAAWERPASGARGRGAFVCVVDSGLDLTHPSFEDAAGRTRVAFLLDVEGTPRGEHARLERAGGAVWAAADIDAALVSGVALPTDTFGHGTAIASVALGDDGGLGAPAPGAFAGLAPEAGLLVVRALRDGALGFEDPDVIRGVDFCFEASPSPERTVVLLALGGHDGAHDGTEPLEQALAVHAARGRLIVVAAGNDGGRTLHAAGRAASAPAVLDLRVPTVDALFTEHEIALVVAGAPALGVRLPDGSSIEPVSSGDRVEHRGPLGYVLIDGAAREGVHYVVLGGGGEHPPLGGGRYRIDIAAPAHFDAWLLDGVVDPGALFGATLDESRAVPSEEVTIPATSPAVLAIGASVSREVFVSDLGTPPLSQSADEEGRALFSSRGPSRSGWPRPDVLAPGALVSLALSSSLDADRARTIFGSDAALEARLDRGNVVVSGSSVSAAVVAGVLALVLGTETAPPTMPELRAALVRSSRGERAWTRGAGAGEIDIPALLDALETPDSTAPADGARSRVSATRDVIVPGSGDVVVVAHVSDAAGRAVHGGTLTVRANGSLVGRGECRHGLATAPLAAIVASPASRVRLEITHDDVLLGALELSVRADEGLRGDVRPRGSSSCGVAPQRSSTVVSVLFAFLLGVSLGRRRLMARACRSSAPGTGTPCPTQRGLPSRRPTR